MIKYSILTSIYKSEKFLKNYFKTISIQKYKPDEIILVDDTNNPKNLKKILNNYKKKYNLKKIILLRNKFNLGPAKSLNKGLKKVKNNLIFRLDVDDTWKKNHVSSMLENYIKNKKCLIYAVSIKRSNLVNIIKCDDYFINENHTLHSSWLINKNVNKSFSYKIENPIFAPEDYATIIFYLRKNFKFYFSNKNTIIYNYSNPFSHGKTFGRNLFVIKKKKEFARKQFNYFSSKLGNSKFKFVNKVYFIFFKFGIIKYLVYIFWTLDLIKLKLLLNR